MQFASALSRDPQTETAVTEVLEAVAQQLPEQQAHLSLVFASPHHLKALSSFLPVVQERLSSHTLMGCTGGGIIGARREVENSPGLALIAAHLPGVTISPFHVEQSDLEETWSAAYWQQRLAVSTDAEPTVILLPDPFTIDPQKLLECSAAWRVAGIRRVPVPCSSMAR
jgi:small ligand-binding sensory domain FIST